MSVVRTSFSPHLLHAALHHRNGVVDDVVIVNLPPDRPRLLDGLSRRPNVERNYGRLRLCRAERRAKKVRSKLSGLV